MVDLAQQSWVIRKNSRTQDAAWRGAAAQGDDTGDAVTHLHRLGSVSEEVKKAVTQGVLKPRGAKSGSLGQCCPCLSKHFIMIWVSVSH